MLARIKEDDQSVPYRRGGYFYYSRTETGKQYPIMCRRAGSPDAPGGGPPRPQRASPTGHPFIALGVFAVSDDGTRLAYSTDVTGFREYTLLRQGPARPASSWPRARSTRVSRRRLGRRPRRRSSTSPRTRPSAPTGSGATGSARPADGTSSCTRRPTRCSGSTCGARGAARYLFAVLPQLHHRGGALPPRRPTRRRLAMLRPARAGPRVRRRSPAATASTSARNGGGRRNFRLVTAPVDDPRPRALERADRRTGTR